MNDLISESDVMTIEWDSGVPHMVRIDSLDPDELEMADLMWFTARIQEQTEAMYQ